MNKKNLIKTLLIYFGIVLFFIILSYLFVPDVLRGKVVNQHDIIGWKGMAQEAMTFNRNNPDDPTAWTNSMFGGMPTTTTIDDFKGDWTDPLYDFLLLGKRPATYFFIALLGGFLLMLSLGINTILSVGGAIAVAFCSYNMQIIQVGHNTKMQAIAFFPWVLAALIFTYRQAVSGHNGGNFKKWLPMTLLGASLFGLALSFQIKANHPQITYYLAIVIFIYAIVLFISLCRNKARRALLKNYFAASALLLVIGLTGIATNTNKLLPTLKYSEYTMRGGSELVSEDETNADGLDLDYATAWSYGWEELPNLMIANYNGGASAGELPLDSETGKLLRSAGQPDLARTMKYLPLYWGPQPFTAGPMYIGAVSVFLFALGLFIYRGKEKWWLLAATLTAVFLALGSHFMWFTELWFKYAPMYNKFRTVSMALTVLQVTVPLLGFLALDRIMKEHYPQRTFMKAGLAAYALTAGFCLLVWLVPGIAGTFRNASDASQPEVLSNALAADRARLMQDDAIMAFLLITAVFCAIYWMYTSKEPFIVKARTVISSVIIVLIVTVDMFSHGKRYLNSEHFVYEQKFNKDFTLREADKLILQDTDPDYRVLDLSAGFASGNAGQGISNVLNSSELSYYHKNIGGYSPAKLQRYQDLIEHYLQNEMLEIYRIFQKAKTMEDVDKGLANLPVLNMLNDKYIIIDGNEAPLLNRNALGHCWFVNDAIAATTPNEEIDSISEFYEKEGSSEQTKDIGSTAIIGKDFSWAIEKIRHSGNSAGDMVELSHYAPNYLRYSSSTSSERAVVFSEIYYPDGWKAWYEPKDGETGEVRDGKYTPSDNAVALDLFRANWILRGAVIPSGEGEIVMRFEPDSYRTGADVSTATSVILLLIILASGCYAGYNSGLRKE